MVLPNVIGLLSFENPVFKTFLLCNSILTLKVLVIVPLIGRLRVTRKVFISPEDTRIFQGSQSDVLDPDIERHRRAHLNDVENIPIYFVAAFTYMLTNPDPFVAVVLMRVFTIARIVHTLVYAIVVVPQPARFLAYSLGFSITGYMSIASLVVLLK